MVKAKQPWPAVFDWLQVLNVIDKETTDGPDGKSKAVGTGPFGLVEWQPGTSLKYARNKSYWQSGVPYLDEVLVTIARDDASMTAQLESGSANLVFQCTLQDFQRLKADPKYQAQFLTPAAGMYQIQPNVTFKPLDDKRVRQALNYAIDRKRIADTVLLGLVGPEDLPWPTNSPAYEAAKNTHYAFDLDKAKSMLASAGFQFSWICVRQYAARVHADSRCIRATWRRSA